MALADLTYAVRSARAGISLLEHGPRRVTDGLQLVNGDSTLASECSAFQSGIMEVDYRRLWKEAAIPGLYSMRRRGPGLFQDIDAAFNMADVTNLADKKFDRLERQINTINKIASAAARHKGVMMMLGLMKARLDDHYYHGLRTGVLFCSLCEVFDAGSELPLATRLLAGILHDAGKLQVPRHILLKAGKLTEEERAIMMAHDAATEKILKYFDKWFPHLSEIAANHHLSSKKKTSDNPHVEKAGVLMRIADIYDALASRRSYKGPCPERDVERIMLGPDCFPRHQREVWYLLDSFPCTVKSVDSPLSIGLI